jgi:hypothetical protein
MEEPGFFVLTAVGNCATKWIAKVFDAHPDVICTHGPVRPPLSRVFDRDYTKLEQIAIKADEARLATLTPDELFDELRGIGAASVYGNAQAWALRPLVEAMRRAPPKAAVQVCNIVRHPVNWVESAAHNFAYMASFNPAMHQEIFDAYLKQRTFYDHVAATFDLDVLDLDVLAFIGACFTLPGFVSDVRELKGVPHVQMEKLTGDRDTFAWAFRGLTGDRLAVTDDYLDTVFGVGQVNRHRPGGRRAPDELWAGWQPWQRATFKALADASDIVPAYGELGYDFGFLG